VEYHPGKFSSRIPRSWPGEIGARVPRYLALSRDERKPNLGGKLRNRGRAPRWRRDRGRGRGSSRGWRQGHGRGKRRGRGHIRGRRRAEKYTRVGIRLNIAHGVYELGLD
jgi:hypothetical protein